MTGLDLAALRHGAQARCATLFFAFQLFRLRLDRGLRGLLGRTARHRVVATACWSFPIYSQTFVYQELTQLIRGGFAVRFLYSNPSRDPLPAQFRPLWRARRRLTLHPAVCDASYAYFAKRMPDRIDDLLDTLCQASGMSRDALREHKHFRQAFAFARMVEAYRPDYVHSYFFYEGSLFALITARLLNIPRGVSCYADHMLDDYALKVVPVHLRECRMIIATSERIKDELLGIGAQDISPHILVKPNGIDPARFPAVNRPGASDGKPFRLVSLSRIEPKKGLLYLVEAVARLRGRGTRVELHLVGGADDSDAGRAYHRQVIDTIQALDLCDLVHLEGVRSEAEINVLFKESHLFVAPFVETSTGDKDGIPTAVLEAMASALPVVATDAGSIPEVIEDGHDGIIVPQRDSEALAKAIEELIAQPDRRTELGRNGAARVRASFDATRGEQVFHDRLRALLEGHDTGTLRAHDTPSAPPLVSIIIIFLNAERFIREAIESVLLQSYARWELLLVDDGSSDGSTAIAHGFAAAQPSRIRCLEHPGHQNRGMSASRNLGLAKAQGKYVAFLDADDVWMPFKLQQQVAILESHPEVAMAFGAAQYWYSWSGEPQDRQRDHVPGSGFEVDTVVAPPGLARQLYPLGAGPAPCPSDLLVRRESILSVGGFEEQFRAEKQLYEDQAFLAKMYLRHPVFVSSKTWIRYRVRTDSCVSVVTGSGQYAQVRDYFLKWLRAYMVTHEIQEPEITRVLEAALHRSDAAPSESQSGSGTSSSGSDPKFGALRRLTPISPHWGFDRGQPVDRHYIEQFLARRATDIHGRVLEVGDDTYTRRFGGTHVTVSDVLHLVDGNPRATITGDLARADHIASETFNCVILTQTLQLIFDTRAALQTVHRVLKPGGVVLATFPGISRVSRKEWPDSWFWHFTAASARRLFEEAFLPGNVMVEAHGNVLAAVAFLHGLSAQELREDELAYRDADYELVITVRAVRASE
jgi:glycosyltransferase involved in cell wall biosynthesis/SAM-dependent methyltransferase